MMNRMFSFGMLCWLSLLLGCTPSIQQEQRQIDVFYQRFDTIFKADNEDEKHDYVYVLEKRQEQLAALKKLRQDMHELAQQSGSQYLDSVVQLQLQPLELLFQKDIDIGRSLLRFANKDVDYIMSLKNYEFYQQEAQAIENVLKHTVGLADYYRQHLEQARQGIVAAKLPAEIQSKVWSKTQDLFKQQIRDAEKDYLELSDGYHRYLEAMAFIYENRDSFYLNKQTHRLKEVPGSYFWDRLGWILQPR